MAARRRPQVQQRGLAPNPLYESPVGKNTKEMSWKEIHDLFKGAEKDTHTCAIEIRSINPWTFDVTIHVALFNDLPDDVVGGAVLGKHAIEERVEYIREHAFAVVRDGEFTFTDSAGVRGSIEDVVAEIDGYLNRLSIYSVSVGIIDGVYVEWETVNAHEDHVGAVPMAEEGRLIVLTSARTAFVMVWADAVEEAGRTQELIGSGNDILDLAPPMNDEAIRWAQEMWFRVVQANRGRNLPEKPEYIRKNLEKIGIIGKIPVWDAGSCLNFIDLGTLEGPIESGREELIRDVGHLTAMQAMGTGVSWTDDYPKHGLKIPLFEPNFIVVVERLRRIRIAYQIVTPESTEEGDFAEQGWENEEGVVMEPDEEAVAESGVFLSGETRAYADEAVRFLTDDIPGVIVEASSTPSNGVNVWYTGDADTDPQTGDERTETYHLVGFTEEEQRYIYNRLFEKTQMTRFTHELKQYDPEGYELRMAWSQSPKVVDKQVALSKLVSHLNYQMAYTSEAIARVIEPIHEFFADVYRRQYPPEDAD